MLRESIGVVILEKLKYILCRILTLNEYIDYEESITLAMLSSQTKGFGNRTMGEGLLLFKDLR